MLIEARLLCDTNAGPCEAYLELAAVERAGIGSAVLTDAESPSTAGIVIWSDFHGTPHELATACVNGSVVDGSYGIVTASGSEVHIISDPLGTVPLFYHVGDHSVTVGTIVAEVASRAHASLDEEKAWIYVAFDYVPLPSTIFTGVYRCPPGSVVTVDLLGNRRSLASVFSLTDAMCSSNVHISRLPAHELVAQTWQRSVELLMHKLDTAEAVGISLSGGLDSRMMAACMLDGDCDLHAYTHGADGHVSDAIIGRQVANALGIQWGFMPTYYDAAAIQPFAERYFSMEPISMSFLPRVAETLHDRYRIRKVMVAAGGDVVWGSHSSYKQVALVCRAARMWRKYCKTGTAAWVAASELGDWNWADARKPWSDIMRAAAEVFDYTVETSLDILRAERVWSMCYRQPSYTWNSNLVYRDSGIDVLQPTLTLDSVLTGLLLPSWESWCGKAYEKSLITKYPQLRHIPLTRTRAKPAGNAWASAANDFVYAVKRSLGLDWYVPWVCDELWLLAWRQSGVESISSAEPEQGVPWKIRFRKHLVEWFKDRA